MLLGNACCSHLIVVHDLAGVELLSCPTQELDARNLLYCLTVHSLFRVVDLRGPNRWIATLTKLLKLLLRLDLAVGDKLRLASLELLIV